MDETTNTQEEIVVTETTPATEEVTAEVTETASE